MSTPHYGDIIAKRLDARTLREYIAFSQIQVKLCKFRALVSTGLYRAIALLFVHALPYLSVYCRVLTELDPCIPVALFALSDY